MREVTTVGDVREIVDAARAGGDTIGLVPTMGYLHDGHLSLVELARDRVGFVVVTLFVNPTQFGPGEDLDGYPRNLDRDRALAAAAGADLLFVPPASEIYPDGFRTKVRVDGLSEPLCGRDRPGHFDGVALVVTKLLNIVRPDVSVFGRKDAQQAILIRRLVRDLDLPGDVIVGPTVRESDGLAMSSRNRYLDPAEREAAVGLSRGLFAAKAAWRAGERDEGELRAYVLAEIEAEPLLEIDYVDLRDPADLEPWPGGETPALLAAAVRVGRARLIDNVFLGDSDAGPAIGSARGGKGTG